MKAWLFIGKTKPLGEIWSNENQEMRSIWFEFNDHYLPTFWPKKFDLSIFVQIAQNMSWWNKGVDEINSVNLER